MSSPRMSGFLVGLVLVSMFASILGYFISQTATAYDVEYDNSTILAYNKMTDLVEDAQEIQNKTNIESESGILDILGKYFAGGYKAIKMSASSVDLFGTMAEDGTTALNLGAVGDIIKTGLITIVLILVFVGIIIRIIVKMDV